MNELLIVVGLLLLSLVGFALFAKLIYSRAAQAERKVAHFEVICRDLIHRLNGVEQQLPELHQTNGGLVNELERQAQVIDQMQSKQSQMEYQDADSRLYNRAMKMVELGADINEVMAECELPKAEAQLLINLKQKIKPRSSS